MALPFKELSEQSLDALITRERTRIVAPLTDWRNLSLALRQEGLVNDATNPRPQPERGHSGQPLPRSGGWLRATGRWTVRIAASATLVGAGVIAGRGMTFGQGMLNQLQLAMSDSAGHHTTYFGGVGKPFRSAGDARRSLLRAQTEYQSAAAFLAATDTGPRIAGDPDTYRDRLVGLDGLTNASLIALKDSPWDAVLNQYYFSAAAAREATIQQLGNALPVGTTLVRF